MKELSALISYTFSSIVLFNLKIKRLIEIQFPLKLRNTNIYLFIIVPLNLMNYLIKSYRGKARKAIDLDLFLNYIMSVNIFGT